MILTGRVKACVRQLGVFSTLLALSARSFSVTGTSLGCIFPHMRTVNRRRVRLRRKRRIDANPRLRETVWAMVKDRYSPQQICGWLRSCYPGDEATYVCPERIYQPLFSQAKYESKKKSLLHYVEITRNVDLVAREARPQAVCRSYGHDFRLGGTRSLCS